MSEFLDRLGERIALRPRRWLITGVAGFIGSHLLEFLLQNDQEVVGLDDFSTGSFSNLREVERIVGETKYRRFSLIEGSVTDTEACRKAVAGVRHVLHQAALGSVPRSIKEPLVTNLANVNGHLNMLLASKEEGVESFVYAASSSTYGDHPALPKVEGVIGSPLSPYAVTKLVNELYSDVFWKTYAFSSIGLRYFNVFGPRQNPGGAYAAVIPRWIQAMLQDREVFINGDGSTSRDFCYVKNVVLANVLASLKESASTEGSSVYNVACHDSTSLNVLFEMIQSALHSLGVSYSMLPIYREFRQGDVRHSLACIEKIQKDLNYQVLFNFSEGLAETVPWYVSSRRKTEI